jgi:hypothetical protein
MAIACPIDLNTVILRSEISNMYSRVAAAADGCLRFVSRPAAPRSDSDPGRNHRQALLQHHGGAHRMAAVHHARVVRSPLRQLREAFCTLDEAATQKTRGGRPQTGASPSKNVPAFPPLIPRSRVRTEQALPAPVTGDRDTRPIGPVLFSPQCAPLQMEVGE